MVLDGAGWYISRGLAMPQSITLVVLPPYSPELNPVERVWLASHVSASSRCATCIQATPAMDAWNRFTAEPGRIKSLCAYLWIEKVCS